MDGLDLITHIDSRYGIFGLAALIAFVFRKQLMALLDNQEKGLVSAALNVMAGHIEDQTRNFSDNNAMFKSMGAKMDVLIEAQKEGGRRQTETNRLLTEAVAELRDISKTLNRGSG